MILCAHRSGTRTLVVVNTIKRAISLYSALKKLETKADLVLIHSHFRQEDRQLVVSKLLANPSPSGMICISTQVIEAGVDISATTLITDLAPWSSMVQRFGRNNRYGVDTDASIIWLNQDLNKKGAILPYEVAELQQSRDILLSLDDAGFYNLPQVKSENSHSSVLRFRDIIDLFDTSTELSGLETDISRYIRNSDEHDVQIFWRNIHESGPDTNEPGPSKAEMCNVPSSSVKAIKDLKVWQWDYLVRKWSRPSVIIPGMILMMRSSDGCYSGELGWTGNKKDIPSAIKTGKLVEDANDSDQYVSSGWITLTDHTNRVVDQVEKLLFKLPIAKYLKENLLIAGRWHDWGKVHPVFQGAMTGNLHQVDRSFIWANTDLSEDRYERRGFRHELASAIAMLQYGLPDLAAYLAASHHGKVRIAIRPLPGESHPGDSELRFARGIWDGDLLRKADLGGEITSPEITLDLSYMEFGEGPQGPSWLQRTLCLRDDPSLGPFVLAYLEALLRVADWRASQTEEDLNG